MDRPFPDAAWQPTHPEFSSDGVDFVRLSADLTGQAAAIKRHPYDARRWLARAGTLSRMGYPELATGDAYKAKILCENLLGSLTSEHATSRHLGSSMGFWMLEHDVNDDGGARTFRLLEDIHELLQQTHKIEQGILTRSPSTGDLGGRYIPMPYPWLSDNQSRRSDELLHKINAEIANNVYSERGQAFEVRRHAFSGDTESSAEVLGAFALRDISKDELILADHTRVWGCNGPGEEGSEESPEEEKLSVMDGCLHPKHPDDEKVSGLGWIRGEAGSGAAEVMLIVKMLHCCVTDAVDPLDHHLVARLTPAWHNREVRSFSLVRNIEIPNRALRQMGVDIFANVGFDTWVLFTIDARIDNNAGSNPIASWVTPLFTFFNHSCDPNVEWYAENDHSAVFLEAHENIKRGEQLFITYSGYITGEPLHCRRERLRKWLPTDCQCRKCFAEAEQATESVGNMQGSAVERLPSWDIEERPSLPEDADAT